MKTLWYIGRDLSEPITYLPYGAVFATVIMLVVLAGGVSENHSAGSALRKREAVAFALCWLFLVYMSVVLIQTIFSRELGSRNTIDLRLFGTLGHSPRSRSYFVENIIMMVPFGIFLPLLNRKFKKAAVTVVWLPFRKRQVIARVL